ncbi:YecA family protein [Adhaeribacter swui]|uniref:YecA family protein n=1 Tax=Adhaeribacter swui TaxID=2086471 RepID=UPI001E4E4628|nr:SEC-C metal-binding domain-containing protein [Adhaeribacter swui]
MSTHELTILSYHLKRNLWIDNEYTMMQLEDDIGADLDLAMLTRRDGAPGLDTPEGILTKYKGTPFDLIITNINRLEHPSIIDLGFLLLSLSSEAIEPLNEGFTQILNLCKEDGNNHTLTLTFPELKSGLTIHCNNDITSISIPRLNNHCRQRKYKEKANFWFGICIEPIMQTIKFGINLESTWVQSDKMDETVKDLPTYKKGKYNFPSNTVTLTKLGRNEKCNCGSGKKYKNCCLK